MAGDADVTLGEVHRRLDALDKATAARFLATDRKIEEGFRTVNIQIASQQFVHVDVYRAEQKAHAEKEAQQDAEISELKANNKWLSRTLIGTVLVAFANVGVGLVMLLVGGQ